MNIENDYAQRSMKLEAEMVKHHDELIWALRTRVLTQEEMEEVVRHKEDLYIRTGVSYNREEIRRRFNDDLFQQFRLRTIAGQALDKSA